MRRREGEPTIRKAYRGSIGDVFMFAATALVLFLNFWPALDAASRTGKVVRPLGTKSEASRPPSSPLLERLQRPFSQKVSTKDSAAR